MTVGLREGRPFMRVLLLPGATADPVGARIKGTLR